LFPIVVSALACPIGIDGQLLEFSRLQAERTQDQRSEQSNMSRCCVFGSPHWTISATGSLWAFSPRNVMKICSSRHNGGSVSGEIDPTSGAIEAEQLSGPERA